MTRKILLLAFPFLLACVLATPVPVNAPVETVTPPPLPTPQAFAVVGDWYCRTEPTERSPDCGVFMDGTVVVVAAVRPDGWLVLADGNYLCGRAMPDLEIRSCQ